MVGYGKPFELRDVAEPGCGPGELRVRVRAAGINPIDFKTRDGVVKAVLKYRMPQTAGNEFAGEVLEVGAQASGRFKVGDAVFARVNKRKLGAFAEVVAVDESACAPKPSDLSFEEAAGVPLVALTAWQALTDVAQVKPGSRVLIHAGAGGVGSVAIQLAKHLGAHVATTCGTSNVDKVKAIGADEVVDYQKARFDEVLRGFDVVLDTLGGESLYRSVKVLKPGGCIVSISGPPDTAFARSEDAGLLVTVALAILSARIRLLAALGGKRYVYLFMRPDGAQLTELARLFESGKLKPVVDRVLPLEKWAEAFAHLESGRAKGKIILTMGDRHGVASTEKNPD